MTTLEERINKRQEQRMRALARRHGYLVRKSRRAVSLDNLGDYMLVEAARNIVVCGERYDATLEEIAQFLSV